MHTFGHPSDIDQLIKVSKDFNLVLIEDAAESIGSFYKGRHTGTFGLMGALSFNGNKTITTGGGGALLTNDDFLATRARHITTTAKLPHKWEYRHDEVGYNYRMPNLNAALGCAQLEQLPQKISSKRNLFNLYQAAFGQIKSVKLISEPHNCISNYWLQALLLNTENEQERDEVLQLLNQEGYMSRPAWIPLHKLPPYKLCPRMDLSKVNLLATRLINIPSSSGLLKSLI
jgi:dTDP-4-amino-4,6-dideoxygalactose transaminase